MAKRYLEGLPQLKAKLERLKRNTQPAVAAAMGEAADLIVASMKNLVPVDKGALRDSIGWTFGDAPKGSLRMARVGSGRIVLTIYAGDEAAYYARWVEFGTAPHVNAGQFKGTENPGTMAQPFFFPAFRANRKEVRRRIAKAIKTAVRDAVT